MLGNGFCGKYPAADAVHSRRTAFAITYPFALSVILNVTLVLVHVTVPIVWKFAVVVSKLVAVKLAVAAFF